MSFKNTKLQLNNYKTNIFFETGTYKGDTARLAAELGFDSVITVELQKYLYDEAKLLSNKYSNIEFYLGDSPSIISKVLSDIDENKLITFWLDAHIDAGNYLPGVTPNVRQNPLFEELESIKTLKRNDHIILIDDLRCLPWHNIVLSDLINKIKEINPNYTISFIEGEIENDILVARCEKGLL